MRRLLPNVLVALVSALSAFALACAGSDADLPDAAVDVQSETIAVVTLTWKAGASSGLAQVYAIDHAPGRRAAALELLSMPAAAEVLDTTLGAGECRVDVARDAAGAIVLRDAGEIMVEGDMGATVLDSSWLPEGSLDVSGIAYAGFLPPRGAGTSALQVVADGSPEVGPFAVQLTPPPAVKLVAVGRHEVVRGRVQLEPRDLWQHLEGSLADARPSMGLDISWQTSAIEAPGDDDTLASSELTVVVFERRTFGATWTISCVVPSADDGHFTIPAGALLSLPDLGADRTDSVVVRRISSASFAARHVTEGMALAVSEDQAYVE